MKEKKNKSGLVVKSNSLINARYSLTSSEIKIILSTITQIKPEDKEFKDYEINIKDFVEDIGVKSKNMYERARETTMGLMKKIIELPLEDELGFVQVALLSKAKYVEGSGKIIISFDPELKPHLLQLKEKFTKYRVSDVLSLKSSFSIRIYELLKQYENLKQRTIKIKELKKILNVDNKYDRYADFKRIIILKAQKELKKHTDIYFEFEEIKKGRKVDKIKFIIKTKNKANILEKESMNLIKTKTIKEIYTFLDEDNKSFDRVIRWIEKNNFSYNYVSDILNILIERIENKGIKVIKNKEAMFKDALKNNYIDNEPNNLINYINEKENIINNEEKNLLKIKEELNEKYIEHIYNQTKVLKENLDKEEIKDFNKYVEENKYIKSLIKYEDDDSKLTAYKMYFVEKGMLKDDFEEQKKYFKLYGYNLVEVSGVIKIFKIK